jgi:hypothetical protein
MLKIAAWYANTWTTLGSAGMLEEVRRRNMLVDKYCGEFGRKTGSLRRSYWIYEHNALASDGTLDCYKSVEGFRELVEPFIDLGINEVLVSYPCYDKQIPIFEEIAQKINPELKKEYNR